MLIYRYDDGGGNINKIYIYTLRAFSKNWYVAESVPIKIQTIFSIIEFRIFTK